LDLGRSILRRISIPYLAALLILIVVGVVSARTGYIPDIQSGDGKDFYMAGRTFSASLLRSGSLPEWNPYIYTGYPHIGDIQNGFYYPPNLILYQLFSPATAFNLSIAFNVFLLAFFTSRFLWLFVNSTFAVWIGSATFALAGFLCCNSVTVTIPNSAAWVPAVFWCIEKWIRTRSWKYCAWGGVCLAMELFAGWPQMVLLTAIYGGVYLLVAMRREAKPARLLAGLVVMGILSAAIGLPQLLSTLTLKNQSIIEHLSYPEYVFASIAPQLMILLFFPFLVGAQSTDFLWHKIPYYAPITWQVNVYYVGVLPLMLAIAAILLWRRSRYVRFGVIAGALSLLLAWGGYTPLARVLYRLPVYNFFHDHRINLIFFDFAIAVLAACAVDGLGFPDLSAAARRRLAWLLPACVIAAAALMLIYVRPLMQSMDPDVGAMQDGWLLKLHQTMRFGNPDILLPIFTLFASGLLFYAWQRRPDSRRIGVLAIILVLADLANFGIGGSWFASSARPSPDEQAALQMMRDKANHQEFRSLSLVKWFYPFVSPNLNSEYDHADVLGLGPFLPWRHSLLLNSTNVGGIHRWPELMINNTVLSLLNTRYIEVESLGLQEITRIFGPLQAADHASSDATSGAVGSSVNLLQDRAWSSGSQQSAAGPPASIAACSRKDCGASRVDLPLEPNAAYELNLEAKLSDSAAPAGQNADHTGFGGGFQKPGGGDYFSVTRRSLNDNPDFNLFTQIYLTDAKPQGVSLYLENFSRSALELRNLSLRQIGSFPLAPNPYRLAGQFGGLYVIENTAAYPRAFFVSSVQPVSSFADARSQLWRTVQPFDARHRALVEASPDQLPANITEGTVERLAYSPKHVEVEVSCPGSCYLVLSDMYYPGWSASVDSQPTAIYLTDAMVRGIVVPAGQHKIEFAYHPRSLRISMLFSLLTLGIIVLVSLRSNAPKSQVPPTSHSQS
jgi:hypothetical protein